MLRALEILLIALPLILFLIWWRIAQLGGPRRGVLLRMAAAVAVLAAALIWFGLSRHLPNGAVYHPAEWRNGNVVGGE